MLNSCPTSNFVCRFLSFVSIRIIIFMWLVFEFLIYYKNRITFENYHFLQFSLFPKRDLTCLILRLRWKYYWLLEMICNIKDLIIRVLNKVIDYTGKQKHIQILKHYFIIWIKTRWKISEIKNTLYLYEKKIVLTWVSWRVYRYQKIGSCKDSNSRQIVLIRAKQIILERQSLNYLGN